MTHQKDCVCADGVLRVRGEANGPARARKTLLTKEQEENDLCPLLSLVSV